jgi:hypothetical protein
VAARVVSSPADEAVQAADGDMSECNGGAFGRNFRDSAPGQPEHARMVDITHEYTCTSSAGPANRCSLRMLAV